MVKKKNNNWIPIKWKNKSQKDDEPLLVTIHRQTGLFYKGIKYAIRYGEYCLNKKNKWEWEPQPSSRTDAFYKRCRFDSFEDAVKRADKILDKK